MAGTLRNLTIGITLNATQAINQLNNLNNNLNSMQSGFNSLGNNANSANHQLNNMGQSAGGLKSAFARLGGVIAGVFAVDKIKDFAVSMVEASAEAGAMTAQFEQVFGNLEGQASKSLNNIAEEAGMLPNRLKPTFTQMTAFAKTTGMETKDALALSERAMMAAADSSAFYDRSIEEVTGSLQSFLKGNFENDAALGISATETTRNAKANELYDKSFKDLSESQKQLTLLAMVEDGNKLSGALGQAARESDSLSNQTGNLKQAWTDFQAELGESVLPIAIGWIQTLSEKLQNVDTEKLSAGFATIAEKVDTGLQKVMTFANEIKNNWGTIKAVITPIATALGALYLQLKLMAFVNTVTGLWNAYRASTFATTMAQHGLNAAMRANPIGLVITAITLLVGVGVALYQNWDTVKEKAGQLWAKTKEVFGKIHDWGVEKLQPVISFFKSLGDKFNTFKNAISNFKLPKWVTSIGSTISNVASKVSGFVNGSHATGLASVPFDSYRAELHKGESVLTAKQSDALRDAGILQKNSDGTPNLNFKSNPSATGHTTKNYSFNISVQATTDKANDIANKVREVISDLLDSELQTV